MVVIRLARAGRKRTLIILLQLQMRRPRDGSFIERPGLIQQQKAKKRDLE